MRESFSTTRQHALSKGVEAVILVMKAVYWSAKEDIATVKYSSLLSFLDDVGLGSVLGNLSVSGNSNYRSLHSAEGIQYAIATVLKDNVEKLAQSSPFFCSPYRRINRH